VMAVLLRWCCSVGLDESVESVVGGGGEQVNITWLT